MSQHLARLTEPVAVPRWQAWIFYGLVVLSAADIALRLAALALTAAIDRGYWP